MIVITLFVTVGDDDVYLTVSSGKLFIQKRVR